MTTSTFNRINDKIILNKHCNDDNMKLQHSYNDIVNVIVVCVFRSRITLQRL